MARSGPTIGAVLFDRDLTSDTLAAVGVGTRDAVYTEAGPVPGRPVPAETGSKWHPYMVGAQSVDLTAGTLRGGYPGRDGASVLLRLATETDLTDFRSWQEPNLITHWTAPTDGWGASSGWTSFAAAVIDETQVIVIVAVDGSGNAQTWSYDPRSDTWTTLYDWDAGSLDGLILPIGMVYDPGTGRLILWSGDGQTGGVDQTAYYSEDGGTTWAEYAREFLPSPLGFTTAGIYRPVVGDDLDWMLLLQQTANVSTDIVVNYASSDRGATWEQVATSGIHGTPVLGPSGFVVGYVDTVSKDLIAAVTPSARGAFVDVATLDSTIDYSAAWTVVDADGTIYVYGRGTSGASHIDEVTCWRSLDGGYTWEAYGWGVWNTGNTSHYIEPFVFVAAAGSVWAVVTMIGSTSTDGTVSLVRLGGFSQVAHGRGGAVPYKAPIHRFGWGAADATTSNATTALYLPCALPGNFGWTAVTSTGTVDISSSPALEITTTAGQGQTYAIVGTHNAVSAPVEFDVRLASSGNVTLSTLGTAGGGVFVAASLQKTGGGGYTYAATVDIGSDGIQLRDGSHIRATQALTVTSFFKVRLHVTKGTCTAWYSLDGGHKWTMWANAVTLTNGGAAVSGGDTIFWGNDTTQIGHAYWRFVGFAADGEWQYGVDTLATLDTTAATGPTGHGFGRCVPGKGYGYPIPFATASGEDVGRLTAAGGPTHRGELVSLPADHTYPIEAIDPTISPSPRRAWRTTTDADAVTIVWDHGLHQETWLGSALALVVMAGTPRLWVLEADDGSTGWTTLGTLDLATETSLKWVRTGRYVVPDTGSTGTRYYAEGELVGGTISLDGAVRRITANSGGYWATAGQRVHLTLDGILGSEGASGTAGVICAPSGVLVYYPASSVARRYVRVTVAGGQGTPEGYYSAGIVGVGRVVGIGAEADWTWTEAQRLSRTLTTATDGVTTARQLGPPARVRSYSWGECSLLEVRAGAADYVAISGGAAIGTAEDAPVALPGYVTTALLSGEAPCVLLPRLPAATGTITDPSLFIYGRMTGALSVSASDGGTEGTDELLSMTGLEITEIK